MQPVSVEVHEVSLQPENEVKQLTDLSDMYATIEEASLTPPSSYTEYRPVPTPVKAKKKHTLFCINARTLQISMFVFYNVFIALGILLSVFIGLFMQAASNSEAITDNLKRTTENLPVYVNDIGLHAAASTRNVFSMSDGLAEDGVVLKFGTTRRKPLAEGLLDLLAPPPLLPSNSNLTNLTNSTSVMNRTAVVQF
jgi:hypothetical protein